MTAPQLDAETARIDSLVAKKQQLGRLLEEDLAARTDDVLRSATDRLPLMYRTQTDRPVMYGIVLPGPDVAPGGDLLDIP